jgi:hypothetical protein
MALITSAASGNFSAGATWTGGVVPGVGDEARASTGHTVTINVNTTCDEISNAGTGKFVINDGITLTANVTNKSATATTNCLEFSAATPAAASVVGNIIGGTVGTARGIDILSSGSLTVTGSVSGGSGNGAVGIRNNSTGVLNVSGNVSGGTFTSCFGIRNDSTGSVNVTGDVTGGSAATNCAGILNNLTGTCVVIGTVTADVYAAIESSNAAADNRISGTIINSTNGISAIYARRYILGSIPAAAKTRYALDGTGNFVDMFTADNGLTQAIPADVRSGTVYADGNLTGTLAVPAAASVAFGVPVDNTTGTAVFEPKRCAAAVWGAATTSLTTAGSIGALLTTNIDATISSRSTATTADIAAAVWDEVLTGATHNVSASAGRRLRQLGDERIIAEGTVQGHHKLRSRLRCRHAVCRADVVVTDQSTGDTQTRFILAFDRHRHGDRRYAVVRHARPMAMTYLLTTVRDPLVTRVDHPTGTVGAEIDEMYLLQGLKDGETLTVTPTSRTAGAVSQTIGGDGTTTTTVSRD